MIVTPASMYNAKAAVTEELSNRRFLFLDECCGDAVTSRPVQFLVARGLPAALAGRFCCVPLTG